MGRWMIVVALGLAGLGCRGQQPMGANPFDTQTRVAPPATGAIGASGDPYLGGGQPATPPAASWWPWSGGTANTAPSLPAQPGATSAPNSFLPSTWFGGSPAAVPTPAPAGTPPGAFPPTSPGSYGPAGAPPGATFLPTTPNAYPPGGYPAASPGAGTAPAGASPGFSYPSGVTYPQSAVPVSRAGSLAARTTIEPPPAIREGAALPATPVAAPLAQPSAMVSASAGYPPNTAVLSPVGAPTGAATNVRVVEFSSLPNAPLAR